MTPNNATNTSNQNKIVISFFPNIHTTHGTTENITDLVGFRRDLKKLFTTNVYGDGFNISGTSGKKDNFLCSPAAFDPSKSDDTDRGLDNVLYTSFLALDFDNGDLTPDDFIRIFWTDALRGEKLTFDIMNSAGHDPDNGINKFRVFMYYTTIASVDEHYAIFDTIKTRIAAKGYPTFRNDKDRQSWLADRGMKHVKQSGLDMSKRPPSSLFYLPGKLIGKEDVAFFRSYGNDANRLKGLLIDPATYCQLRKVGTVLTPIEYEIPTLAKPIANLLKAMNSTTDKPRKQDLIDTSIQQYNQIPIGNGQRYSGLFNLAAQLKHHDLTIFEIETCLRSVANGDSKILGRINGVLKNIQ